MEQDSLEGWNWGIPYHPTPPANQNDFDLTQTMDIDTRIIKEWCWEDDKEWLTQVVTLSLNKSMKLKVTLVAQFKMTRFVTCDKTTNSP